MTNDKSILTSNKHLCCGQVYKGSLYIYDKTGSYTVVNVHVALHLFLEERLIRNISQS